MNSFLRRSFAASCLLVVLGLSHAAVAGGDAPAATVAGETLVRPRGGEDFASVAAGGAVTIGSTVRAPEHAATGLTLADGVGVRLGEGATVTIVGTTYIPAEHPGAKPTRAFQLVLASGELAVDVGSDPAHPQGIVVLLPAGASFAAWRGSAQLVAQGGGKSAVALYQGTAIAGANAQWRPIPAGSIATFAPGAPPVTRAGLPRAPEWATGTADATMAVVTGDQRTQLGLTWAAVEGAASYRVEVATDEGMKHVVAQSVVTGKTTTKTEPLSAGAYWARVRPVTAEGILGPESVSKPLRVLHAVIPPAAFVANDGAIVLPASGGIALEDAHDVEVAYQKDAKPSYEPVWVPAPRDVSLGNLDFRIVRLRDARTHAEAPTRLTMVRRTLRAVVEMSPKGARWPEQPVDIVVRATDPSGRLDATREVLAIEVRVNLTEVPLAWHHVGSEYRAHLDPAVPPGPWAVRVAVRDAAGDTVGAGLLEVVGPRLEGKGRPGDRIADSTEVHVSK